MALPTAPIVAGALVGGYLAVLTAAGTSAAASWLISDRRS